MAPTSKGKTITSRVLRIVGLGPVGLFPSLLCVLCFAQGQSQAQCEYEATVIQPPTCPLFGHPPTDGFGLNELGHVVGARWQCGSSWGDDAAFLWTTESGIEVLFTATSSLSVTCVVPAALREKAVQLLHRIFFE